MGAIMAISVLVERRYRGGPPARKRLAAHAGKIHRRGHRAVDAGLVSPGTGQRDYRPAQP
jgi:hypothetical protein